MTYRHKISLFSLVMLIPIFISITKDGHFGFDRIGGINSDYFISLPISIALCLLMILLNVNWIFTKKFILFFFGYLVFCIILKTMFNHTLDFSILKVTTWMFTFVVLNYVFRSFFSSIIYSRLDISQVEKKYIIYPLILLLLVTMISHYAHGAPTLLSDGKGVFIYKGIKSY